MAGGGITAGAGRVGDPGAARATPVFNVGSPPNCLSAPNSYCMTMFCFCRSACFCINSRLVLSIPAFRSRTLLASVEYPSIALPRDSPNEPVLVGFRNPEAAAIKEVSNGGFIRDSRLDFSFSICAFKALIASWRSLTTVARKSSCSGACSRAEVLAAAAAGLAAGASV